MQSKIKAKEITKYWKINMMKIDPGEASLESISIMVGEQITVKQLIEKRIIMTLSRHDHVYRHHIHNK